MVHIRHRYLQYVQKIQVLLFSISDECIHQIVICFIGPLVSVARPILTIITYVLPRACYIIRTFGNLLRLVSLKLENSGNVSNKTSHRPSAVPKTPHIKIRSGTDEIDMECFDYTLACREYSTWSTM